MITTNSGSSWQPFGPSGSTEPVACLPASSLSSTDCWVTHGSQVEATTDGGSSWSAFGAPLSNVVYAISCISPATCGILLGGGTNDGSSIVESTTTGWDTLETFPYIDQVGNLVFDSPSDTLVAVGVDLTNTSLSGDQVVWSQAPGAAPARALARSGGNRPRSVLGGNATSRGSVSYGPRAGTEHVWLSEATRPRDQGSIPARPSIDSRHPARSSGLAVRSASSST